jgi:hypothetical protein
MLTKLYRLMAPEGDPTPTGGGAPSPVTPTATPAPGPAPFDPAALARDVASTVRDSIFAELRKSGVLGKVAAPPTATDPATPAATATAPASTALDVEALLERRENFAHALGKFEVPDTAIARARKAFTAEKPDDVNGWVSTFATEMGWKQRSAQPPAPAGPPAATSTAPAPTAHVTERPGPPASHVVTDDTPLRSMSFADREAYRQKVGDIKFADRYLEELKGVRVKTRPF